MYENCMTRDFLCNIIEIQKKHSLMVSCFTFSNIFNRVIKQTIYGFSRNVFLGQSLVLYSSVIEVRL